MITATVTEIPPRLEAVTPDAFLAGLDERAPTPPRTPGRTPAAPRASR